MYYHATNIEGFKHILNDKKIITDYEGDKGIFLTKDIEHAKLFGSYIFMIYDSEIDEKLIEDNDSNDGVFYIGGVDLSSVEYVIVASSDRVGYDMYNGAVNDGEEILWRDWGGISEKLRNFFTPKQDLIITIN